MCALPPYTTTKCALWLISVYICRWFQGGKLQPLVLYDCHGVFSQRSLVDSWSRGVQYVLILHSVQYVLILTQGALWSSMVKLSAYVQDHIWDTAINVFKADRLIKFCPRNFFWAKVPLLIVSYNKTDIYIFPARAITFLHCPKKSYCTNHNATSL